MEWNGKTEMHPMHWNFPPFLHPQVSRTEAENLRRRVSARRQQEDYGHVFSGAGKHICKVQLWHCCILSP